MTLDWSIPGGMVTMSTDASLHPYVEGMSLSTDSIPTLHDPLGNRMYQSEYNKIRQELDELRKELMPRDVIVQCGYCDSPTLFDKPCTQCGGNPGTKIIRLGGK